MLRILRFHLHTELAFFTGLNSIKFGHLVLVKHYRVRGVERCLPLPPWRRKAGVPCQVSSCTPVSEAGVSPGGGSQRQSFDVLVTDQKEAGKRWENAAVSARFCSAIEAALGRCPVDVGLRAAGRHGGLAAPRRAASSPRAWS